MIMNQKNNKLRKIQYEIWELEDKQNKIYMDNERLKVINYDKIRENNKICEKIQDDIIQLKEKLKSMKKVEE